MQRFITHITFIAATLIATLLIGLPSAFALTEAEVQVVLKELDDRRQSVSDYRALIYIDQVEEGQSDTAYELVVYRRQSSDRTVLLFTRPRAEAGKGYLRIDRNLFLYDPTVGNWERRTERERIGGTGGQRADFDSMNLSENFTATYEGEDTLGAYTAHHLKLTARDGVDVPYPILEIWVDKESGNLLKQEDYALSERLMRTLYYPNWQRIRSEDGESTAYFPREIRIFDEVETGNRTTMVFRSVELEEQPDHIFTRAWIESRSR